MEYYNKILCVTFAELTGGVEPVMKASTLRQNVCRSNIACARRGGGEEASDTQLVERSDVGCVELDT